MSRDTIPRPGTIQRHGGTIAAMIRSTLAALLLAVIGTAADPERFPWHVVSVEDGDTLVCADNIGVIHKIRLQEIGAPQLNPPFGIKARARLVLLTLDRMVDVETSGRDRTGRVLARVFVEGQEVNAQMVAACCAWSEWRADDARPLAAAERAARAARRGLWADREPVPPWEWRASEKRRLDAAAQEEERRCDTRHG